MRDGRTVSDGDIARIREDLERRFFVAFTTETIHTAVLMVAEERRFHPVREYLRS